MKKLKIGISVIATLICAGVILYHFRINLSTEGQIYKLDWTIKSSGTGNEFPILPYNTTTDILDETVIVGEELGNLKSCLLKMIQEEQGSQALCHMPIYGIRLTFLGVTTFQTSICWKCNNYYVGHEWRGLPDTPNTQVLSGILASHLPIPDEF